MRPDEDVSDGVRLNNNNVDLVFVGKLMEVIYEYIKKGLKISHWRLRKFIAASGISEVELTIEDMKRW